MLLEDPQVLFDQFVPQAKAYLDSPGVMAALELDAICAKLYPVIARVLENVELSNQIRDFGRNLPRKEIDELRAMLDSILADAKTAGLSVSS
ncbi:hypothetical protein [Thiolapillus sp.]